jgi:hypothetical protein
MKAALITICVALVAGCAAHPAQPVTTTQPVSTVVPGGAAALAFDPPVTLYERPLNLDRTGRGEAAFAGYEDSTTTYFDIWTNDRRTTDLSENYVREGYSEQVGSTRR